MKICMIITAAGMSTRQNTNKLLIRVCGETIIEKTVNSFLHQNLDIFVVVGHQLDKVESILYHRFRNDIEIIENVDYESGISSSIKAGILAAGKCDYYGFCNGDKPYIQSKTIEQILSYLKENRPMILVPLFQEQSGHPTFFSKEIIDKFKAISGDIGGQQVIQKFPSDVVYLSVNDEGVVMDMDKKLEKQNNQESTNG